MRTTAALFLTVALGVALGLWSAWLTVRSPAAIDAIVLGPWRAWPNAGTSDVDPYTRARLARTGEVALGSGEGLMLLARTDGEGAQLRSDCDYRIAGETPPARLWTLDVEDEAGRVLEGQGRPAALGSDALLRQPNGSFQISLSRTTKAGNWVPTVGRRRFQVVVRLYDTTARTGTALTTLIMPEIKREACV